MLSKLLNFCTFSKIMLVVSTDIKQEKIEVRHVKHVLTFLPENKLLKNRKITTNFDDFPQFFGLVVYM